jgi:phospholipid/cholesterol/gamma-HCH transport system substrate-binding protein
MIGSRGVSTLGAGVRFIVFAVVTVLATMLLAFTIANVDTQSSRSFQAVFSDAANVIPGDEVRMAGVRVGTVTGVGLYAGTEAKVSFTVASDVPVTSTTRFAIRYRNLIGQRYVAVEPGPSGGTAVGKHDVIPVERTQPALNLTVLFNGFRPLLTGLSPADVNALSYQLVQVLQGEGGTVDTLFARVGSFTGALADRDRLIGDVIDNLDAVLGPIAAHDQQLSALVGNLQQFLSGLSQDRGAISSSLVSIDAMTGATQRLLTQARPALASDIRQLGVLAEKLDAPASRQLIQHFLTYTPFKLKVATPEASYAAFLNFYVCAVNFILPNGTETPYQINSAKRCHIAPVGVPQEGTKR